MLKLSKKQNRESRPALMVESLERRELFAVSYSYPPPPLVGARIGLVQPSDTTLSASDDSHKGEIEIES